MNIEDYMNTTTQRTAQKIVDSYNFSTNIWTICGITILIVFIIAGIIVIYSLIQEHHQNKKQAQLSQAKELADLAKTREIKILNNQGQPIFEYIGHFNVNQLSRNQFSIHDPELNQDIQLQLGTDHTLIIKNLPQP